MFRTTLTVLFAALTLSVPAFAQKGATGQDATQAKPLAELKETESTWEEVPVLNGTGSTKPQTGSEVIVVDAAPSTNDPSPTLRSRWARTSRSRWSSQWRWPRRATCRR